MGRYFLTVDAGTGSIRAIIFDTLGNQVGMSQQEWTHTHEVGVENSMTFEAKKNYSLVAECIKGSIANANIDASEIVAVTATSMREGIVLYDKNQEELWGVANVDARSSHEVSFLNKEFPNLEKEFYNISGQTFALGALPRLLWLKNNKPDIYEKVAHFSMISDWVLARLSGVIASDPSNAGTSGVFSLKDRKYDTTMAKVVGIKDDIFPPVYESGEIIGEVTQKASKETGLCVGTPVVMGGGDVQLGSAGLGVVKAGESAILGGSFWQQIVNMDQPLVHPNMDIRVNPHVIKGLTQAEAITFFPGLVMKWFRDTFCEHEVAIAKKRGVSPYSVLEELSANVPAGSYGVLPIFSDAMHYGKWQHAAPSFLNLSLDPARSSKAVMFRALEENAAIVSMLNLKNIFEFTKSDSDTLTFAGGASKGALWSQILADVTQRQIKIPRVTEATALGGAFLCGVAVGEYSSVEESAKTLVTWGKTYELNVENRELYEDLASKWQRAYSAQLELMKMGVTESMWKAPGL
ncbi:MAG: autoinducer-2 kinase [Helicobacteraceae bacterium]|nr:autoinducer-2 kinase [Helicobacteraceae bacterium]